MADVQQQANALPAILDLSGGVRLSGDLSAQDGQLRLSSARLVKGASEGGAVSLRNGTPALLRIESDEQRLGVVIGGITGNTVALKFQHPQSEEARRFLQRLENQRAKPARDLPIQGADPESTELLKRFANAGLDALEDRFETFMGDLRLELMELSMRGPRGFGQQRHDEAADAVKSHSKDIVSALIDGVSDLFGDLTPDALSETSEAATPVTEDALGLVDIDEFEHDLAVDRIVKRCSETYDVALECLTLRTAELADRDPRRLRLPFHIAQLARGFQRALRGSGIPHSAAADIFDFYDREFARKLGPFYRDLNSLLSRAGVRPELEEQIRQKGSLLRQPGPIRRGPRPAPRPAPEPQEEAPLLDTVLERGEMESPPAPPSGPAPARPWAGSPPPGGASSPPGAASPPPGDPLRPAPEPAGARPQPLPDAAPYGERGSEFAERMYNSLMGAISSRRAREQGVNPQTPGYEMQGGGAAAEPAGAPSRGAGDAAPPGPEIDTAQLAAALGALQSNDAAREALQQGTTLRDYLDANLQQLDEVDAGASMAPDALDRVQLVDNLFGTINTRMDTGAELRPALRELQIPLARVAMAEPGFMLDRKHPARSVVDQIAKLASTASFPNRALETRINEIVQDIVRDYDQDTDVFGAAAEKIERLLTQQERALSRKIDRVIRTQEGQEKLGRARAAVDRAVYQRLPRPEAPSALLGLIENGWRDLMVLTSVREGEDSAALGEQLEVLTRLAGHLEGRREAAARNLTADPVEVAESLACLDDVAGRLSAALPTDIAYQDALDSLRQALTGEAAIDLAAVNAPSEPADSAQARSRVEELPRLRRWIKRVEQLQTGNWLSYRDGDGQTRRMQLAWISPDKDRFIFVNERGQKNADLSAVQLARQLSRGVRPPSPAQEMGMVDRSVYDVLEEVQKSLSFERNHDSLTRLINEETFRRQLQRALAHARNHAASHSILYLDIDQFSLVNEVYDRVNGDVVLFEFSKLLAQLHGKKTSTARIDSDEFGILLLQRNMAQAQEFAERIRQQIESTSVAIEGEQVSFTVSIGVAPVEEHSQDADSIIAAARGAMERAKEQGRNTVVCYDEDQSGASNFRKQKAQTRQDLEAALQTDRFTLRAQPIVQSAIDGSELIDHRYELLLGWRDKSGDITSPQEFIRSAERYGFMTLVDRWVVREAFAWISRLMDDQKVVPHLAINLSGASITDDSFMEYLFDQISEFGVGTNRICFEITEAATISNLVKAGDFVRAFRNIGCKFSVDDFGTGLASHDFLRELPVDFVKIDGTFIKEIDSNRNDYAMARSINDLAHFLGQETIAESVENDAIVASLREIGVDYLQGWGIGIPELLEDIAADLSSIEK